MRLSANFLRNQNRVGVSTTQTGRIVHRVQTPGTDPREALIVAHLPHVETMASKICRRLPPSIERADVISDGLIGLVRAAASFDVARGLKFWTFARHRVLGAMLDGLRQDQGNRKYGKGGSRPFVMPWPDDETPFDVASSDRDPELQVLDHQRSWMVRELAPHVLNIGERAVVFRLMEGESQRQIATALGISESSVSNFRVSAVKKLRRRIFDDQLAFIWASNHPPQDAAAL